MGYRHGISKLLHYLPAPTNKDPLTLEFVASAVTFEAVSRLRQMLKDAVIEVEEHRASHRGIRLATNADENVLWGAAPLSRKRVRAEAGFAERMIDP